LVEQFGGPGRRGDTDSRDGTAGAGRGDQAVVFGEQAGAAKGAGNTNPGPNVNPFTGLAALSGSPGLIRRHRSHSARLASLGIGGTSSWVHDADSVRWSGHSSSGVSCQPSAANQCCTGLGGVPASVAAVASLLARIGPSPHTAQAMSTTGWWG